MGAVRRVAGSTFGSLRVRNYRLYFIGQVVSVSGSWMQRIAQSWLVLHLTGSGVALGVVAALQFLPMLVLGAWGGVLADRMDKRRLLMLTQAIMGFLALVLGAVTLAGAVQLWMVYVLALALGLVTAMDNPARQSFVMEMVGRGQVTNAVSLNSAVFTGARVVGPAIAGLVISLVGTGWCFVINAVSFGAVVFALVAMDPAQLQRPAAGVARRRGMVMEGLRFVWSRPDIRLPLAILAVVGTLALNWTVLLPLLARNTFHGDAGTYGLLFAVLGLGSLAGALFTASRREPSGALLLGALAVFGVLMAAAAVAPTLPLELVVLAPTGMAALVFQTSANSLIQLRSDPSLRGRVMSLYAVLFIGTTPIGAPIVGWVAQQAGPRAGLLLGAATILVTAAVAAWLARSRHVFAPRPRERERSPAQPGSAL
ncbi:MAG: MFS transporter [Chloroflexi bacterium]|nr:MAG: MFS transporter [Chloroflexota bacterium]